jgi:GGDEF domain-containing protein
MRPAGPEGDAAATLPGPPPLARFAPHEASAPNFRAEPGAGAQSMSERVERMLAQCRRQRGVMALVCVRIERLDSAGGELPSALRRQVCADLVHRMRSRVRGSDLVVQESELVAGVLMAGAGGDAAQRVVQRFAQALSGPYRVVDRLVEVTVRVGHAACPADGMLGAELVLRAQERMGS